MKKFFLVLGLIFSLCSCTIVDQNINTIIYVGSIGLAKEENDYLGYFFFPNSFDVGSLGQGELENNCVEIKGNSIRDLFIKLDQATTLIINFKHIATIILDQSIVNIYQEIYDYLFDSKDFDYNFYLIGTKDNMNDIYGIKNLNNESILYSLLLEPYKNKQFKENKPIHFLNFNKKYFNNEEILLPVVSTQSLYSDEKDSLLINGYIKIKQLF